MLPKRNDRNGKASKYADTGIPLLVDTMVKKAGANKSVLTAKIFGGAKMFNVNSELFDIGRSNAIESKMILDRMGISIVASKVGGTKGYQINLDTKTGVVQSKVFGGVMEKF
jgi:chemotaxis protein CheD